jgi:glutathione synthase
MKLVAQMDEMMSVNIETDSTFALLLEAQNRGHEIFYYLPKDLNFNANKKVLTAEVKKINLQKIKNNHCTIIEISEKNLTDFDVILIRQDPPFDMNYITSTYLLETIKDQVLILNDPSEIRNCPEKIFIANFPHLIAPTLITSDQKQVENFRQKYNNIILKPLYSCGGDGVVLLKKDDINLGSVFDMMLKTYKTPLIVQKFLPEISAGDRRIILLDGEIIGGIARIAKAGDVRSNLHVGGYAEKIILSARETEICKTISFELKKRGLFFVGIDVIGDYLTEINVTSPTCIPELNKLNQIKAEEIIIKKIEKLVTISKPCKIKA